MRFLIVTCVLAAPAIAQTTDCYRFGAGITCTTRPPIIGGGAPFDFLSGLGGVNALPNPAREIGAVPRVAPIQQRDHRDAHASVAAALIAKGQCEAAIRYLQSEGEERMAENAARVCITTSPPR